MGRMVYTSVGCKRTKLIERERLIVLEINSDAIYSASSFVDYLCNSYGFSKSSIWYNLNRLREKNILDFATKDDPGRPLALTKIGMEELAALKYEKNTVKERFAQVYMERFDTVLT